MRKLIEIEQKNIIECDTPKCDFVIPRNIEGLENSDGKEFINMACPRCGNNLLTEKDYHDYNKFMKTINWVNKWFSWLTLFKRKRSENKDIAVKVHKGYKIEID